MYQYDDTGRLIEATTATEPEWDEQQVALMLAHESLEASKGPHGVPFDIATDPKHAWDFISTPITDYAAAALAADQKQFFKEHDTDKDLPMNRNEILWSVRLKDGIEVRRDRTHHEGQPHRDGL